MVHWEEPTTEAAMPGPEKRLPGQDNTSYERSRRDPNADFQGTHSLYGGGDPTWAKRLVDVVWDWRKRRRSAGQKG